MGNDSRQGRAVQPAEPDALKGFIRLATMRRQENEDKSPRQSSFMRTTLAEFTLADLSQAEQLLKRFRL